MKTPKDRLTEYLKIKRLSLSVFADQVGVNKAVLSRISEATNPKTLQRIESASDLNADWLIRGEGEMLNESDRATTIKDDERLIPFYDVETTGGYNGHVSSSGEGELVGYVAPGGWFDGRETAAIRHVGDSMKEYPNGCILAVKKVYDRHLLVYGKNYVIETREYRITKRVQKGSTPDTLTLYSTNNDKYEDGRLIHEPFELELNDILNIYSVLGYIVNQTGEMKLVRIR